jgi:demethylmenaquinone methyltransferase/2-methoxy-6-polyprenyl-1,4-benzoquinol methylase
MERSPPIEDDETWFGDRRVETSEKPRLVRGVFERVAGRYDLMNDLMSGGIHRLWKAAMIDWLAPRPGQLLLDVAGGTGDIAHRFLAKAGTGARVVVCDLTPAMLAVGRDRAIDRGLITGIDWVAGDAQALPLADRSVDAYTIAFGLRNVAEIDKALAEARRVLKPGGRFLCLEFSKVTSAPVGRVYDAYSERALPLLGRAIAGDAESYRYLHESIRRFPSQRDLARRMGEAGFERAGWRNMTLGVVALHTGWRI